IARLGMAAMTVRDIERSGDRYEIRLAELGVPPALRRAAAERVVTALTKLLVDKRAQWLLSEEGTHREVASEFALSGRIGGDIVNVVIDRTFVDQGGTRWIVDFKTSSHEGGGLEQFLANEEERYRAQLHRYAQLLRAYRPQEPIRAALYFPLMSQWREVALPILDVENAQ
ncbi:MAG: PD-(D/E)XK nuclease family protein, partial [Candidatus Obscuribacterales bacterium]|nr:PD-(D/E)XK nuclease family protein [Steroidobacteraceae bacterium]